MLRTKRGITNARSKIAATSQKSPQKASHGIRGVSNVAGLLHVRLDPGMGSNALNVLSKMPTDRFLGRFFIPCNFR